MNTFVMRVREWYSWHFPELVKIVNDNYQYAQVGRAPAVWEPRPFCPWPRSQRALHAAC